MKINEKRLLERLYELRDITVTPGGGVTRFSFSEADDKVRKYITDAAKARGCYVIEDQLRNLRIGAPGNSPDRKTVLCGSHIDTVMNGGWLDGIYGTVSALEVLLAVCEQEKERRYNYEMVVFSEEEGSNFGSCMTGSKFLTGIYGEDDLDSLTDGGGRSLREYLGIEKLKDDYIWDLSDAAAMYELHIEQGPVLDDEGIPLGLVDSICGMRVVEITVEGVGNHAGGTPMANRYDALTAAAECILAAEKTPRGRSVATVGRMDIKPNVSNVIPETVTFSLEVRDNDVTVINDTMESILTSVKDICAGRGVKVSVREHSSSLPIYLDRDILELSRQTAADMDIRFKVMPSGAVHDAAMMAPLVPTGMIFVPSINGRSHVPEEDTRPEDLLRGARLLAEIITRQINKE